MAVTFAGPTTSTIITRNPSVDLDYNYKRLNHVSRRLASGASYTLDMGPTLLRGTLTFNYVKGSEARALKALLVNDCRFSVGSLTITPPSCVDLGLGDGVAISCKLTDVSDTESMFSKAGVVDRYSITIPYEFVVSDSQVGL